MSVCKSKLVINMKESKMKKCLYCRKVKGAKSEGAAGPDDDCAFLEFLIFSFIVACSCIPKANVVY